MYEAGTLDKLSLEATNDGEAGKDAEADDVMANELELGATDDVEDGDAEKAGGVMIAELNR